MNFMNDHSHSKKQPENNFIDTFDEFKILNYRFEDFDKLSPEQKKLIYYLSRAALCGRDIIYDQNYSNNLPIRKSLECIYENFSGDRNSENFQLFYVYLKKIWFSNGIHHPYSKEKLKPGFSKDYLKKLILDTYDRGLNTLFTSLEEATNKLNHWILNQNEAPYGVIQDTSRDMVQESAVNFYEHVTQKEAESFYQSKQSADPKIAHGLNTRLTRDENGIHEIIWYADGEYSQAIKQIVFWLNNAIQVAENQHQKEWLEALVQYYKTGDLQEFNHYNIAWVKDTQSTIDLINGFIETYSDPLGIKGTWESIVHVRDEEATQRTHILSKNAQWFEDHAPVEPQFKKEKVTGVSATVVNVAMLGGESHPTSPIGVNLPNADWIRKEHGSKSITLNNISYAHHTAMSESGMLEEFAYNEQEIQRSKKWGFLANNLHTDLHECLGHGSGKLLEEISSEMLKNYQAPIEEARADLFALYYMLDPKMQELGIMDTQEVARAQYDAYIRNGMMTQLTKIQKGKNLEQAHMRNRQLIASWCYEKGMNDKTIERKTINNKTYFIVNDYFKLQELFGQLLSEIQQIKSTGDYEGAKHLVESYGTKINPGLHEEVLARFKKLNIPPFTGFINPEYEAETDSEGNIRNISIRYPKNFTEQMLYYSKKYSFLSEK
jgi:dipeptidyl-peptidase-3